MLLTKKKWTLIAISLLLLILNINIVNVDAAPEDQPTEENQTEERSTQADLSSLSVNDAALSPAFSPNVTEYTVNLPQDTTWVVIDASAKDENALIDGIGEYEVSYEVGTYDYKLTVTCEDGTAKTYVIHVLVSSEPVLFTNLDGVELGFVVKDLDKLTPPDGFVMDTDFYSGNAITVFRNDHFPFSLVYLENSAKKADWYCYQDGVVTGVFRSLVINRNKYYYAGVSEENKKQEGYNYREINVFGEKLNGWTVDREHYETKVMLYLYDTSGKADYYVYDTDEQTLVNRIEFEVGLSKSKRNFLFSPMTIAGAIVVVIAAIFLFIIASANHHRGFKDTLRTAKNYLFGGRHRKGKHSKVLLDHTVELVRTSKVKIYASTEDEPVTKPKNEDRFKTKDKKKEHSDKEDQRQEILAEKKTDQVKPTRAKKNKKAKMPIHQKGKKKKEMSSQESNNLDIVEDVLEEVVKEEIQDTKQETSNVIYEEDPMNEIQKYIDQLFYLPKDSKEEK